MTLELMSVEPPSRGPIGPQAAISLSFNHQFITQTDAPNLCMTANIVSINQRSFPNRSEFSRTHPNQTMLKQPLICASPLQRNQANWVSVSLVWNNFPLDKSNLRGRGPSDERHALVYVIRYVICEECSFIYLSSKSANTSWYQLGKA